MQNSPDTKQVYQSAAARYHALVLREDYENNLLPAILAIDSLAGKDVVELGMGTGRLTRLITPLVKRLIATDNSYHMLSFGWEHLRKTAGSNMHFALGSHMTLPFARGIADVVIAGWSFCYTAIDAASSWETALKNALQEVARVMRPGGCLILIESLGTGYKTPHPPDILADYLDYLEVDGFTSTWIRTDYRFEDVAEALDLISFFFGEEPLPMWETAKGVIVPECTGLWWKKVNSSGHGIF